MKVNYESCRLFSFFFLSFLSSDFFQGNSLKKFRLSFRCRFGGKRPLEELPPCFFLSLSPPLFWHIFYHRDNFFARVPFLHT